MVNVHAVLTLKYEHEITEYTTREKLAAREAIDASKRSYAVPSKWNF